MSIAYIRKYYQLTVKRGDRVRVFDGKLGVVVGAQGAYLRIKLDGEKRAGSYHPTWELAIGETK